MDIIPTPTNEKPYVQIEWIFNLYKLEYEVNSSRYAESIVFAKNKYIEFIVETNGYYASLTNDKRFYLDRHWEFDALIRFHRWLKEQDIASLTKYSYHKITRAVLNYAYSLSLIDSVVYNEPFNKGVRETDEATAYSEEVESSILLALDKYVALGKNLLQPYKKVFTGGKYLPLEQAAIDAYKRAQSTSSNGQGAAISFDGKQFNSYSEAARYIGVSTQRFCRAIQQGLSPEEIAGLIELDVAKHEIYSRYIFEQEFSCDPVAFYKYESEVLPPRVNKSSMIRYFFRWGVWTSIDADVILPLAIKLIALTGLNLESVKSMTLDSYNANHQLTGQPVITYMKARSASSRRVIDRELHIDTLECEEFFINISVKEQVHELIKLVIELTSKIRDRASEEINDVLFIYERSLSSKMKFFDHDITSIREQNTVTAWNRRFVKFNNLTDASGKPIRFNSKKFRPTLASNMILTGANIFQVSVALGHESVMTTNNYLSGLRLTPEFNKVVSKALTEISRRSKDEMEARHIKPRLDHNGSSPVKMLSGCSCRNPYNPSENVREATNYREGSLCKYWNMCLLCKSSFVTESGLPKLINYKLELETALRSNSAISVDYKRLMEQLIEIINGILEPDEIFPEDILDNAKVVAYELDEVELDQLVYQGL